MSEDILKNLIQATGISEELISTEIKALVERAGIRPHDLTIDDLRVILSDYVQEVLLSAKEHCETQTSRSENPNNFTLLFPLDLK